MTLVMIVVTSTWEQLEHEIGEKRMLGREGCESFGNE